MATKNSSEIRAKKIVKWLNSEEGKQALRKANEKSRQAIAEFRKSIQLNWQDLHTPFGPADGSGIWPHQRI